MNSENLCLMIQTYGLVYLETLKFTDWSTLLSLVKIKINEIFKFVIYTRDFRRMSRNLNRFLFHLYETFDKLKFFVLVWYFLKYITFNISEDGEYYINQHNSFKLNLNNLI